MEYESQQKLLHFQFGPTLSIVTFFFFFFGKKRHQQQTFFLAFDGISRFQKKLPDKYPEDKPQNSPEEVELDDHDTEKVLEAKPQEESFESIVRRLEKSIVRMDEKIQSQQQEQKQQQQIFMKEIRKELTEMKTEMKTEFANVSNKIK